MQNTPGSFTRNEIYGQPETFAAINASLPEFYQTIDRVFSQSYDELIFTGCGTSLYAAQTAAQVWCVYNDIPAHAVCCSELYLFSQTYLKGKRVLVLPITRKSCTTEVVRAIKKARSFPSVKSLAITCDPDSAKYNDSILLAPNTSEKSVVMTRSFTGMLYIATIMSMYVGGKHNEIHAMEAYPAKARELLTRMDVYAQNIVDQHPALNLFVTLGHGVYYGVANECTNKIKEMSLSHSEAFYTMEYRHGPMSLADEHTLVLLLAHPQTQAEDTALLEELKSYGSIIAVVGDKLPDLPCADHVLDLGLGYNAQQSAPLIGLVGQFLGYHLARKKGLNADVPRHLSLAIVLNE